MHAAPSVLFVSDCEWLAPRAGCSYEWGAGNFRGIPGPFIQSQRLPIYKQWAEWLVAYGHAYRADETPEELEARKGKRKRG